MRRPHLASGRSCHPDPFQGGHSAGQQPSKPRAKQQQIGRTGRQQCQRQRHLKSIARCFVSRSHDAENIRRFYPGSLGDYFRGDSAIVYDSADPALFWVQRPRLIEPRSNAGTARGASQDPSFRGPGDGVSGMAGKAPRKTPALSGFADLRHIRQRGAGRPIIQGSAETALIYSIRNCINSAVAQNHAASVAGFPRSRKCRPAMARRSTAMPARWRAPRRPSGGAGP